ncbi:MAG: hypothetical protein L0196_07010 [candidate division Zixibacteria bacterium]|nr:hypothetical protein [candidate division Zixibacteria bacterium]
MVEHEAPSMVCPCCGKNSGMLTLCDAHDWYDEPENEKYRNVINQFRPRAGENAYQGHGCMVCPSCEEAFYRKPDYCPLAILQGGLINLRFIQNRDRIEKELQVMLNYWREQSTDGGTIDYRTKLFNHAADELTGGE